MVLAVAIERACTPGPKRDLTDFLGDTCRRFRPPNDAFSGQVFHRLAQQVTEDELEAAQVALAGAAVRRFELSTDVLRSIHRSDTHIATTTPGLRSGVMPELASICVLWGWACFERDGARACIDGPTRATALTKWCWSRA